MQTEYEYYTKLFKEAQAVDDAFNDRYGFPRKDLAMLHIESTRKPMREELNELYLQALANRAM